MSFYVSALSDETLFQAILFSYGTSMVQIACVLIFSFMMVARQEGYRCDARCMLASPIFFLNSPEKNEGLA